MTTREIPNPLADNLQKEHQWRDYETNRVIVGTSYDYLKYEWSHNTTFMERALAEVEYLKTISYEQVTDMVGSCTRCGNMGYVGKFSLPKYEDMPEYHSRKLYCADCMIHAIANRLTASTHKYGFSESLWHNLVYENMKPVFVNVEGVREERCYSCTGLLFIGIGYDLDTIGARYVPVKAINSDNDDVIVHTYCQSQCTKCEVRYASSQNRISSMWPMYNGSRDWCTQCVEEDIKKRGLSLEICDSCGGLTAEDEIRYSDIRGGSLCSSCYAMPVYCEDCDSSYHEERGHTECSYEFGSPDIRSYSYKPRPKFFGTGNVFMGIELEVECQSDDCRYYDEDYEEWVRSDDGCSHTQIPHRYLGGRAYYKEDGSLDNGFEIVTHPHTLEAYQNDVDWRFLRDLSREGVRSWDNDNCGLHVHIGKAGFEKDADGGIQSHAIRFTKFVYDNEEYVSKLAGRKSTYATFNAKGHVVEKIKRWEEGSDRYSAVNTNNSHTYELRIFKGSLRKARVLSAIEFTHAVLEHTRYMKVAAKHKPFAWSRFVAYVSNNSDKYPNLFEIINEIFETTRSLESTTGGM